MTKRDEFVATEAVKVATAVCIERIKARLGGSVDEVEDELRRLRERVRELEAQQNNGR
jgi:hypothetical protein